MTKSRRQINGAVFLAVILCWCGLCNNLAADSLVGYWRFDEGSGTTAADESAEGNDGTLYNMDSSTWVSGRYNTALELDGTEDYIDFGTDSVYNFSSSNAFTIALWIKPNDLSNYQGIIGKWGGGWYTTPYQVLIMTSGKVRIGIGNGSAVGVAELPADSFSIGEWTHIAFTYDGSVLRSYANGVEQDSNQLDYTLTTTTNSLKIGHYSSASTLYLDGAVDAVRMYDYALNADDIKVLSNGLRGAWEMNEGTGLTVADDSEYGNDATMYNMDSSDWVGGHLDKDGYFRYALSLDGTEDYIDCGNDDIYNFNDTNTFTVACWIRPNDLARYQGIVGKWGGGWYTTPYQVIVMTNGSVKIGVGNGTACETLYLPAENFSTGEWSHIAFTYDGSVLRGYANGDEAASSQIDYTITSTMGSVRIGRYSSLSSLYFDGDIDKVYLYDRALTAEEIKAMQLLSAYPDRNYYTGENAVAVSSLDISDDTGLTNCYLVAKDSSGNTLGTNSSPGVETDLTYATSSLSNGDNTITVELRKNSGERVFTTSIDILKRAANTGNEVKIDYKKSIVLRNGNGFFPIGMYLSNVTSDDTEVFQEVANAGFNSIIRLQGYGVDPSDTTTYLENADDYNLLVVNSHGAYSSVNLGIYKWDTSQDFWDVYVDERNNIFDAIDLAKLESNLLSYYAFDECQETQVEAGEDIYDYVYDEDGYHPTFAVLRCAEVQDSEFVSTWCDILGTDSYVKPPRVSGELSSSVDWVSKFTCIAKNKADKYWKPLWMVLNTEYSSGTRRRIISAAEQRCQTWVALIHGAKGIFYWRYPVYHDASWDALAETADDLADLGPSILTQDLEQTITYYNESVEVDFNPVMEQFVDVQVKLLKAPSSASYDYVLLAANTREYEIDVDYEISLLGTSGTVSRLFDTSTYTVSSSGFSDTLAANATRAYTFTSASTDPITISVDMDPQGTYTEPTVYPDTGRPSCTNIMQNPSFEDEDITGWPNYVKPWQVTNRITTQNQSWGIDTTNPYHGSKCLMITRDIATLTGAYFYLTPQHTDSNGKDYTYSVYLKTDAAGVAAGGIDVYLGGNSVDSLDANDDIPYRVTVDSTDWTRYQFTVNIPANFDSYNYFYIKLLDMGTVWVDALQIEQASSASSFTTD